MGDACSPENLAAIIAADSKLRGYSFQPGQVKTKGMSDTAIANYNIHIAKHEAGFKGLDPFDTTYTRKTGLRSAMYPSQHLGNDFYEKIAKLVRENPDVKSFKNIEKPLLDILNDLKSTGEKYRGKELNKITQEKYRFEADKLYDAYDWVLWLSKKGHLESIENERKNITIPIINKEVKSPTLVDVGNNMSAAMARMSPTWTLGNTLELSRPISAYALKPDVLIRGISETFFGGNPLKAFQRQKKLVNEGVYSMGTAEKKDFGNYEPFAWSVTLQKNLAYNLDIADGGNGISGVTKHVFDPEPWDRAPIYRDAGRNEIFGLARYPIAESVWHINTTMRALKGDKEAAVQLMGFFTAKAFMFGTTALIPAPLYAILPEENEDHPMLSKAFVHKIAKEFEKNLGTNAAGRGVEALGKDYGTQIDVDFSGYAQPFGGTLGAKWNAVATHAQSALKSGGKAGIALSGGDVTEGMLMAAAAGIAFTNLFGIPNGEKLGGLYQPVNNLLNNTTVFKVVRTHAKNVSEKFEQDRAARDMFKALFGSFNVKKGDAQRSTRPQRPKRPKRPSRNSG